VVPAAARQIEALQLLINAAGVNHFGLFESDERRTPIADLIDINLTASELDSAPVTLLKAAPQAAW